MAEIESQEGGFFFKKKIDIFEVNEIGLNGCGWIWTARETYFENFDIFMAKEIGLNVRGQILISRERYFENFDIFKAKDVRF